MFSKSPYRILVVALAIMILACNNETVAPEDLDAELEALVDQNNLPSIATGVFQSGELRWSKYYGLADQDNQYPVNENTIYHIGSISKLFIATAIMQLEEQGLLNLDADINTYLPVDIRHPDYPESIITSRMLLSHTAGIAWPKSYNSMNGMWNLFPPDEGPAPSVWVPEYLIVNGLNYDPTLWKSIEPGLYEQYSNIGTCVLAYIVEQVSGENFREYCRFHIFQPLGMEQTSFNYADIDQDEIAVMYDRQGRSSEYFDNRVYPAGGAKSTVNDLMLFAQCILNGGMYNDVRILEESTVSRMLEIQNPASGRCLIWDSYLGSWKGHTGGLDMGTATTLSIHPESSTGFIIFTNTTSPAVHPGGEIYWLIRQKANSYFN